MQQVAVITDTLACLTTGLVREYGIGIVPLNIQYRGKVYRDWIDINPTQAYELFQKDPESWGSSAPSPAEFLNAFREAAQHFKSILAITGSARLTTTNNSARLAAEQAMKHLSDTRIEVMDSMTATASEGLIALSAARAARSGKDLGEVMRTAEKVRDHIFMLAVLDTIRYVYRSGRVPKFAARAGSILNIRPMLTTSGGLVRMRGLVRNKEQGIARLLKIITETAGRDPVHVAVMHAYALKEAERLKDKVAAAVNCVELWLTEFSPLMGYACGTGTLGLAFYKEV
jgi:DegV family protein with EDD domain